MFDIGFFELVVIAVVLLLVIGPDKLPEVAKQAAYFVRKVRQGMFRLRSEMRDEIDATPFADFQKAKQELADLKRDIRQMGSDLANAAERDITEADAPADANTTSEEQLANEAEPKVAGSEAPASRKTSKSNKPSETQQED